MHIPTVLYGYIIQAFRLPFTTHHSPSLQWMILQLWTTQRQEYNTGEQQQKALLLRVEHYKATNLL